MYILIYLYKNVEIRRHIASSIRICKRIPLLKPQSFPALSSCSNSGCIAIRAIRFLDSCTIKLAMSDCLLEGIGKTIQTGFMKTILLVKDDAHQGRISMHPMQSRMDVPIVQPHDFFQELPILCLSCAMLLRLANVISGIDKFYLQQNLFNHAPSL